MERFAIPVPCLYSDGDQEQVKGQLGIYSVLTFKRFQQLMTQKTGVPATQLSAVLAYKRTANGEEKRQKLNINESTNFGIVMRIHAKEIDAHFLISRKKSKRDRKGVSWRKTADVEEENDVRDEGSVSGDVGEGVKTGSEWKDCERSEDELNDAERKEYERKRDERKQAEQNEAERNEAERTEAERKEAERDADERFKAEPKEGGRGRFERNEAERETAARKESEWKEAERKEADWKEVERKEAEQKEVERIELEEEAALRNAIFDSIKQMERDSHEERIRSSAEKGTIQQIATGQRRQMERQFPAAKTVQDEPLSPVSTLPAVPGFSPPSPVSPDQEFLRSAQSGQPVTEALPRETRETHPSNKAAQRSEPVHMGSNQPLSDSGRSSVPGRFGGRFDGVKQVTILKRPSGQSVSTSNAAASNRSPQLSTASEAPGRRPPGIFQSEASFSGRPREFSMPGARPENLTATGDFNFSEGRPMSFHSLRASPVPLQRPPEDREAFLRPGRLTNGAVSSSGRFQQPAAPVHSERRFAPSFPDASVRPTGAFPHPGPQFGSPDKQPTMGRHVSSQSSLDTRLGPPHQNAPGSRPVSASVFASAVSAAAEALAPNASAQAARHVAGRETGHVALRGSSYGVQELTPLERAGLHGVLRDLAAASGRREGFAGFAKTCKFCAYCMGRQSGPTPFHWCVDDRVVSGFRGPSPAGPIERPGKRVEAAA